MAEVEHSVKKADQEEIILRLFNFGIPRLNSQVLNLQNGTYHSC